MANGHAASGAGPGGLGGGSSMPRRPRGRLAGEAVRRVQCCVLPLLLLVALVGRATPAKAQAPPPVAVVDPPAPVAAAPPPLDGASLRIVGDTQNAPDAGPTVSIGYPSYWGGASFCTGTLISPTAVITAAHCLDGYSSPGRVILGSERLPSIDCPSVPRSSFEEVAFDINDIFIHERYKKTEDEVDLQYDMAVIRLRRAINTVEPAKLALSGKVEKRCSKKGVLMQGWGATSNRGATPCRLQEATVPIWSKSDCAKQKDWSNINCSECRTWLCAGEVNPSSSGSNKPGTNTCFGDSGGPLYDCKGRLAGVTSYGTDDRCGYSAPDRFARLAFGPNRKWLKKLSKQGVLDVPAAEFRKSKKSVD